MSNGDYISREANGDDFVRRADIVEKFMDRLPSISVGYLCKIADEIPPADVRPVVRCRDCKYRPYSTEPGKTSGFAVEAPDRECKCPCFNPDDGWYSWIPDDYFFCGNGERRGADMRPAPEPPAETPAPICQTCGNFKTCPWRHEGIFSGPKDKARRVVACSDYKRAL